MVTAQLLNWKVRVETLEGTTADHETRITSTETDIIGRFKITFSV